MPKYRIKISMITDLAAFIEAENEDQAYTIAREMDGGEFSEISNSGDWIIDFVEPVEEKGVNQFKHRYEVHTWTLCQGWVNCWTVTALEETPHTFKTIEAAQAEIDEFFADIEDQINSGERASEEGYDPEEFRIYDNVKRQYVD
ncbi:MAG: hypothetical protein NPINA01_32280 [Nitrospinaceae bacterium]|nr:MAG: hypothetical protein NPINA01_32280 [Nitrospinaceae bacterium]